MNNTLKLKKDEKAQPVESSVYYKLVKEGQYFYVETITIEDGTITKTEKSEPAFINIAFAQMRKKVIMEFYS